MSPPTEDRPASAAYRDDGRGVEVRDARGRLICQASTEQAAAALAGGVGRLVGGGRVLRIDRGAAPRQIVAADSLTTILVSRKTGTHEHHQARCWAYRGVP